jgi:hypothetical protein
VSDETLATAVDENNYMRDYIAASVVREAPLKSKNNTYSYLTMVVVLFVLVMLLLAIHRRMKAVGQHHPNVEMFGYQFPATVLTSGLTVMVLIAFQYVFYLFGLQFRFAGMGGLEELQFGANNAIRELYGLPVLSM